MYGEVLRLLRSFHQLNQNELAEKLDISRSYLSELESGKKKPSLELLQKYAHEFDIPLSALIFFTEKNISDGDSPRDIKVKDFLSSKAISILQWIEKKAITRNSGAHV